MVFLIKSDVNIHFTLRFITGAGTSTGTQNVVKSVADKKLASTNMALIYSQKPINGPQSNSLAGNL